MPQILSRIKQIPNGAKFYKVDLHVHTPASPDYKDKKASYSDVVNSAIQKGIALIAVTDHNTGKGYEEVKKAASAKPLVVLPGVEITVGPVHILGIFPEKRDSSDIIYLLHNLGIKDENMGKKETISNIELSIPTVLKQIEGAGGIAIAAHVGSEKGLARETKGQWRTRLIQHESLKILEVTKDEDLKYFNGSDPQYKKKLSCIRGSDAHSPEEIGNKVCWIKMGECSFGGLRQIVYEPDLRIRLRAPEAPTPRKIIGMHLTGGLYKDYPFHFNENLNCLIGGRGAGKSAVIDFIRFALDFPPRSEDYLRDFNERIVNLLGVGNTVRLYVSNNDDLYLIERTLTDYETKKISGKEERVSGISSECKIYQIIDDQFMETPIPLREVFDIEVFGQGEVFELTKQADNQLKLIDEYVIGTEDLYKKETELQSDLRENAKGILLLKEKKDELEEDLSGLPQIKDQIYNLEKQLEQDVFKKHDLWESEKSFFNEIKGSLRETRERIEERIEISIPELPGVSEDTPNLPQINQARSEFGKIFADMKSLRKEELNKFLEHADKIKRIQDEWEKAYDAEQASFKEKLRELKVESLSVLSRKLRELRDEEFRLEKKVKVTYGDVCQKLNGHQENRSALLDELEKTRAAIHDKREDMVKQMSSELEKGDVKIEINPGQNREKFFRLLDSIYRGTDIKKRVEQLQKVCVAFTPKELVELVRRKDVERLITAADITEDSAKKIVYAISEEQLLDIETCALDDELVIYLRKPGDADFSLLKDLSYGEKCSAIFSIALIGKKKPLLVDQPEDELDHAFIINNIVEHIRSVKETRQLLISTHNANIPVLGDAELIFKVSKIPGVLQCKIDDRGAFEKESIISKLQDLEGGPEAFRRRREKYGILNSSVKVPI